jgi:hypothetical protein
MKPLRPPRVETRRAKELEAELFERARAWIPSWGLDDDERDFGRALLKIAARFGSEVAERLDRAGEKTRLGFLDWLAVQGEAARPARLPVVFKLTDSAREAKPAAAATRLQVEAAGTSVILETETEVLVLPRGLQALVGVDGAADAFFLAPPGLTSLAPLEPLPVQWQLKSFASNGATRLQLDPEQGLAPGMLVELGGRQYRITQVNRDIVTLDPPLAGDYAEQSVVTKVTALAPFDGAAQNRQEHALYIGHKELFDIEAAATIEITGARELAGMAWHYWGKRDPADETGWQALPLAGAPAQAASGGIVLAKPKGAMEMLELVPGSESRWIRASVATVEPGGTPLLGDGFEIRVNCEHGAPGADPALAAPDAEGMANTTPLVLDNVFFPLGKDPRQFDAFYLGSQEAFSKKGAQVQLCFEIADPNFASLTSLRSGPQPDLFLAGVAADGQLHLFQFLPLTGSLTRLGNRVPLRPPAPAAPGAPAPQGSLSVALDPRPAYRVPVWLAGTDIVVAVAARGAVWLWREIAGAPNLGGWFPLDAVGPVTDPATPIDGLVYLADGAAGLLCALRDGTLFVRDLNAPTNPWQAVETREGTAAVALAKIAPICLEAGDLGNGTLAEGLVGVSTGHKLFAITLSGPPLQGTCSRLFDGIATTVAPVAVRRQPGLLGQLVAAAVDTDMPPRLVAGRFVPITFAPAEQKAVALDPPPVAGAPLDMHFNAATLTVAVSLGDVPGSTALASWVPFAPPGLDGLFKVQIPAALGAAAGAPTLMARHVLVPTSSSQVIVAGFDLARRLDLVAPMHTAIIAVDAADRFAIGDRLAIPTKGTGSAPDYKLETVNAAGVDFRGRALYEFNHQAIDKPLFVYPVTPPPLAGTADLSKLATIKIVSGAPQLAKDEILLITTNKSTELYVVKAFDALKGIATLDRTLDLDPGKPLPLAVGYVAPQTSQALIRPMLHLDPLTTGNWPAALLDSVSLFFPGAEPAFQAGTAYKVVGDRPELVVLAGHWLLEPLSVVPGSARFIVDDTVSGWVAQLGDTSTNPELSWEYWNGKGWWKLDVSSDGTLFLKKSGAVHFEVPADIASSDWAGKTNYWVRARLVGGDYGRETVSVTTEDLGNGKSKQTVDRSTEGIRAPSVARLRIAYSVCDAVQPGFVLVRESGSVRDQSDANRTPGAMVEAFVPLALLLGRLSGPPAAAAATNGCPPDCQCPGADAGAAAAAASTASAPPAAAAAEASAPALGRAIYLGFDAPLLGEPVNLLLLVEERPHDEFAPMSVEALVGDRFVPVVVNDATRALGESGVLSLAFPIAPTPRELFGQTLSWLRLAPASGPPSANWRPKLLGAWLNGVWASAAETLTRELIGSSQGEPNLTLYLARPPVLRGTLELRVKEPLGEEEREALNADRAGQVLGGLENQPGDWVLWQHVTDPGDEAPAARVYALDEATGEIRFGDGRHGRIPPVGRDSIMALAYRRTALGAAGSAIVPGNAITARTSLNLVSPIDGVEAVFAADQAAGGAPAEDADLVLRFGAARLRHRERALTARDVEDLVLESFPDIAQARCFPRQGFVQLVAVVKGADPVPGAARLRELHRMLLDAASPMLGARQALRIRGPALRRLRVDLRLRVASLDDAGAVARVARRRIVALFDTATGGVEGGGWPLGANPGEADIAAGLADVPRLQGIAAVELHEIGADGSARPWPAALKGSELPWLAQDGVRIAFETVEVAA